MLIRHAISEGNEKCLIYGHGDYDLTEQGVQQAKSITDVMSKQRDRFTGRYCSALKRTSQTGGLVLGYGLDPTDAEIKRDGRFNEFDFGPLEGIYTGRMDYFEHEIFF